VIGCETSRSQLRCVWLAVPQPTEWQRIGDQIDAPMILPGRISQTCFGCTSSKSNRRKNSYGKCKAIDFRKLFPPKQFTCASILNWQPAEIHRLNGHMLKIRTLTSSATLATKLTTSSM
jgi:hypothetical protein